MKDHREDSIESAPGSTTIDAAPASGPDPGASTIRRPDRLPDVRSHGPPDSIPDGNNSDPSASAEADEARELLRLVEAELRLRELPIRAMASGTLVSRCPSIHRSGPGDFEAGIDGHGSLSLRCQVCDRTTLDFLILLGLAGPTSPDEPASDTIDQQFGPIIQPEPIELLSRAAAIAHDLGNQAIGPIIVVPRPIELPRRAAAITHDLPAGYPDVPGNWLSVAEQSSPGSTHREAWGDDVDESEAVATMLARHPIRAVGVRPSDWATRDLLFGSPLRDPRMREYARLCRSPEDWQLEASKGMKAGLKAAVHQSLALRKLYYRMLFRATASLPEWLDGPSTLRQLQRLLRCPPYGVLVDAGDAKPCGLAQICPWCSARWASEYFARLMRGPCRPEAGGPRSLLLGRLEIPSSRLPYVEGKSPSRAMSKVSHRVLYGPGDPEGLSRAQVDFVRSHWGEALRCWAEYSGAVGGVILHRIGPGKAGQARQFIHHLTILAEVPRGTPEDRARFVRVTGIDGGRYTVIGQPMSNADANARPEETSLAIPAAGIRGDRRSSLRSFWFGIGRSPGHQDSQFGVNRLLKPRIVWGLNGAACIPSWYLFEPEEYWAHAASVRGVHLAASFGTWHRNIPTTPRRRTGSSDVDFMNRETRSQRRARRLRQARRRAGGQNPENTRRAALAGDERAAALEVIKPIFDATVARSGAVPGRGSLTAELERVGHHYGANLIKDVLKVLKEPTATDRSS
jgi:hypothetical protein